MGAPHTFLQSSARYSTSSLLELFTLASEFQIKVSTTGGCKLASWNKGIEHGAVDD